MYDLEFVFDGRPMHLDVQNLIIAGWTGRDACAVEEHIAELEAIGVARPRTVPCFYRVGKNLLTTDEDIDQCGSDSSGEAEFVLISTAEGLFIGVGSDHTDRKVETYGVTVSKQMCPKPIGRELWRLDEVKKHWDSLNLRSWITCAGERRLYQEGSVSRMRTPDDLVNLLSGEADGLEVGTVLYCGTLPVLGAIGHGDVFEIELEDPFRGRKLQHRYKPRCLAFAD